MRTGQPFTRPQAFQWSEEQKMRIAGQCMAGLIRINMNQDELQEAAQICWDATRALERVALKGGRKP